MEHLCLNIALNSAFVSSLYWDIIITLNRLMEYLCYNTGFWELLTEKQDSSATLSLL